MKEYRIEHLMYATLYADANTEREYRRWLLAVEAAIEYPYPIDEELRWIAVQRVKLLQGLARKARDADSLEYFKTLESALYDKATERGHIPTVVLR